MKNKIKKVKEKPVKKNEIIIDGIKRTIIREA